VWRRRGVEAIKGQKKFRCFVGEERSKVTYIHT